ncbi:MAG TPA: hypothetical protein VF615_01180 [Longimicrobiaceae bacterium]|jgi:hypothetical protein
MADSAVHTTRSGPDGEATLGGTSIAALIRSARPEMRIARIAAVTAGLVATGAVVGAAVGALMMSLLLLVLGFIEGVPELWEALGLLLFGACFAAPVGAVLGPIVAWLLMRHVPLWEAVRGTALGTIAAGTVGMLAGGPFGGLVLGLLGFGTAALSLCIHTPRREQATGAPVGPALLPE